MYTASQLNQCRCAHQAISVINRLRRSFEEDITSSGKKPNPGSLPAIMAKIALKGKCLGKTAIAAIAAPGGDAAWGNKVFSKESTAALVFQTQSEIDLNTKNYKYRYKKNFAQTLSKVKDVISLLFLRPIDSLSKLISDIHTIVVKTIEPIRPGRRYPRNFNNRNGRFHYGYQPTR